MSSPIRKIFSSRSISSRRASRRAARNSFSGIGGLPFAGVDVSVELLGLGGGALVRELDDFLHLLVHLGPYLLQVLLGGNAGVQQLLREAQHGIPVAPALLLFVRAVPVRVDDGVALGAVVDRLDEAGLGIGAGLLHDL